VRRTDQAHRGEGGNLPSLGKKADGGMDSVYLKVVLTDVIEEREEAEQGREDETSAEGSESFLREGSKRGLKR